nr:immunoglobulin heavy chain junction region [Mus musculus]
CARWLLRLYGMDYW